MNNNRFVVVITRADGLETALNGLDQDFNVRQMFQEQTEPKGARYVIFAESAYTRAKAAFLRRKPYETYASAVVRLNGEGLSAPDIAKNLKLDENRVEHIIKATKGLGKADRRPPRGGHKRTD